MPDPKQAQSSRIHTLIDSKYRTILNTTTPTSLPSSHIDSNNTLASKYLKPKLFFGFRPLIFRVPALILCDYIGNKAAIQSRMKAVYESVAGCDTSIGADAVVFVSKMMPGQPPYLYTLPLYICMYSITCYSTSHSVHVCVPYIQ